MAASPPSPGALVASEAGADYFATDAHYQSFAGRIVAALQNGGFVLVTGDPPVGSQILIEALREALSRYVVIAVQCGPELRREELLRAMPVLVSRPVIAGRTAAGTLPLEAAPPVFVFDDVDALSDSQIKDIPETLVFGDCNNAAGVLLARPGFLFRLEGPSLGFLKERLVVQLRFQEVGPDEGIAYLRHQLMQ